MAKLKNQITINLDQEAAQMVEYLANHYQRKPAELLRLLVVPTLCQELAKASALESATSEARLHI